MKEKELIKKAVSDDMPDIEAVRMKCLDAPVRHRQPLRYLLPAGACAAAVLAAVILLPRAAPPVTSSGDTVGAASSFSAPITAAYGGKARAGVTVSDTVYINTLDCLPDGGLSTFFIEGSKFDSLDYDGLCGYYGNTLLRSDIPSNFTLTDAQWGISRDENGNICYDRNCLSYSSDVSCISLTVSRLEPGLWLESVPELEKSEFSGTVAWLAEFDGTLYAQFELGDTGFDISGTNISPEKFTKIISGFISREGDNQ